MSNQLFKFKLPTLEEMEEFRIEQKRQEFVKDQLKTEMQNTFIIIAIPFPIISIFCLLYFTHFWELRGDKLILFIFALSSTLTAFFCLYLTNFVQTWVNRKY